jgi:hypothetical protein
MRITVRTDRICIMWNSNPEKHLRPYYAFKARTLEQAAHAAHEIAAAEHLPIDAAHTADPERWHREAILKMVPVYGTRLQSAERVPASARLDGDRAAADTGEWSDLTVRAPDFRRYLDWLHSIW